MRMRAFAAGLAACVVLIAVCMALLAACGQSAPDGEPDQTSPAPAYSLELTEIQAEFRAEDGTEAASYRFQRPRLTVTNLEELSDENRETAQGNLDRFNGLMQEELDAAAAEGKNLGEDVLTQVEAGIGPPAPYYEETDASWWMGGNIISIRLDWSAYTGGAHPNYGVISMTYDLAAGQFIDPIQISDDPLWFQQEVSDLLITKAEELGESYTGSYWSDYKTTICRWNQGAAVFDGDGLTVIYSPYDLGPYAMGSVELHASYDEIGRFLGDGGRAALGLATAAE